MTDPKAKAIPQWQRQEPTGVSEPSVPDQTPARPPPATEKAQAAVKAELLEQGTKWLEHEDIREAPLERKASFLESKGLNEAEIYEILEVSSHSNPPEQKTITSHSKTASSESSPAAPQATSAIPPIITYPEFLVQSHRPPPFITKPRLLSALYVSSATVAAIYGTSKYLLNPMLESLDVARHSLFETATSNVDILNEKLEGVVSTLPSSTAQLKKHEIGSEDDVDNEDLESQFSDPTELFHRDTGTQTSPPVSPSTSSASLAYLDPSSSTPLSTHTTRLKTISTSLSSALTSSACAATEDDATMQGFGDLQEYLLDIINSRASGSSRGEVSRIGEDDEISRVKAEIRGIKGILLNAKTFPGTGVARSRVPVP